MPISCASMSASELSVDTDTFQSEIAIRRPGIANAGTSRFFGIFASLKTTAVQRRSSSAVLKYATIAFIRAHAMRAWMQFIAVEKAKQNLLVGLRTGTH